MRVRKRTIVIVLVGVGLLLVAAIGLRGRGHELIRHLGSAIHGHR
jgi:hypothetical protein